MLPTPFLALRRSLVMWTANWLRRFPLVTAFIADTGDAVVEAGYPLSEHFSVRRPERDPRERFARSCMLCEICDLNLRRRSKLFTVSSSAQDNKSLASD